MRAVMRVDGLSKAGLSPARIKSGTCWIQLWQRGFGGRSYVFIHGTGEGAYVWDDFLARIDDGVVVAVDLRGHGDSDWDPSGSYTEASYATDIVRVINWIGSRNVRLVGHSLGAAVAIRTAVEDTRVQKLVVIDFGPGMISEGVTRAEEHFRKLLRRYSSIAEYCDVLVAERPLVARKTLDRLATAGVRQGLDGMFELKCDPALARNENDESTSDEALYAHLQVIACPTLVVRGDGSAVFPLASAQRMAAAMQNAAVRTVPMAGHAVMLDNPDGFADAVLPFLTAS